MSTTVKSNSDRESNPDTTSQANTKDDDLNNISNKVDQSVAIVGKNSVEQFINIDANLDPKSSKANCEENFCSSSSAATPAKQPGSQDLSAQDSSNMSHSSSASSQMQTSSQGSGSSPLILSQSSSPAQSQQNTISQVTPQTQPHLNSNSAVAQAQNVNTPQPNSAPQPFFIQQPLNASPYHLHQLYPHQQMIIQSGNLTIQHMPAFQPNNGGLSLQIPNVAGALPLSNVASKPPIASKGVAISPIASNIVSPQNQMLSSFKSPNTMIKPMIPSSSSFQSNNAQTVFISPFMPNQPSIISNQNKSLDNKGKFVSIHWNAFNISNLLATYLLALPLPLVITIAFVFYFNTFFVAFVLGNWK